MVKSRPTGWRITVSENGFFIDIWRWEAEPVYNDGVVGDVRFGGSGYRNEDAAHEAGRIELIKRGLSDGKD